MTSPDLMSATTVVFDAGARFWSVPANSVREIHETLVLTKIPGTAEWFLGTAVSRGRVVAVSDYGAWLGSPTQLRRFIEFDAGFVLGVGEVSATSDSEQTGARPLDPLQLVRKLSFLNITSARLTARPEVML